MSPHGRVSSARMACSWRRSDDPHSIRFVENRASEDRARGGGRARPDDACRRARGRPARRRGDRRLHAAADLEREMYEVDREASADIRPRLDPRCGLRRVADLRDRAAESRARPHLPGDRRRPRCRRGVHGPPATGVSTTSRASGGSGADGASVGTEARTDRRRDGERRKRLVTESQHENLPMRRLNEKLGYRPTVANIVYQGPLVSSGTDPEGSLLYAAASARSCSLRSFFTSSASGPCPSGPEPPSRPAAPARPGARGTRRAPYPSRRRGCSRGGRGSTPAPPGRR